MITMEGWTMYVSKKKKDQTPIPRALVFPRDIGWVGPYACPARWPCLKMMMIICLMRKTPSKLAKKFSSAGIKAHKKDCVYFNTLHIGKSARDNPKRYCRWFSVHCSSKKFERMARAAMDICLRVLKKINKSRVDSISVMNSVLIISP